MNNDGLASWIPHRGSASDPRGADLKRVWFAATTEDRDRKELLRALIEEVIIS